MARRKNGFLSDGSDSEASGSEGSEEPFNSEEDEDSKQERRLFEYNGRKRRKVGGGRTGKESAWEGIFGEDDGPRAGGRGLGARRGGKPGQRSDWTKAPKFVSRSKEPVTNEMKTEDPADDDREESEDSGSDQDEEDEDEEDVTAPASPRVREDEDDQETIPRRAGLGGLGSAKAGTSSNGGIGSSGLNGGESTSSLGATRGGAPGLAKRGGRAGIGARSKPTDDDESGPSRPSFESSDSVKGGLGSTQAPVNIMMEATEDTETKEAGEVPATSVGPFGRRAVDEEPEAGPSDPNRQSRFPGRQTVPSFAKPTQLTAKEALHFKNISSTVGAKLLAGMGWNAGEGLGKDRGGRAVPVEVGKVFRGQGLQSGMRTEDSKREARRRGEIVSDDEEEKPRARRGRGAGGQQGGRAKESRESGGEQSWKKQKKVKVKVEHKTYEQLLAEAGDQTQSGVGAIYDGRSGELKEVQSLSALSLSNWTPSSDTTQLPELRHNLRLIVDVAKGDVDALAREGKNVNERRKWALREEQLARKRIEDTSKRIARLERLQKITADLARISTEEATKSDPSLHPLTDAFHSLLEESKDEYVSLGLDEVIVGSIAQVMRKHFGEWQPFDISSDALLSSLKTWRKAYNLPSPEDDTALVTNGYDSPKPRQQSAERVMTSWESLLWNMWLPRVRSAINNDWNPNRPDAAVHLLESWGPILPPFIRDNILDQLILPKVRSSIDIWDGRKDKNGKSRSLASIVFPWLPILGERMDEILETAKRKIRNIMRKWVVKDGVPQELERWKKDIYSSKEWDELMLRNVVPKLGICLRDDFTINPRAQDMVPLEEWVLPWHKLLRSSTFTQLLEVNFFPKFLDILYIWLVQPNYVPDEVANWFVWWKGRFPQEVLDLKGVAHGFKSALQLMDQAIKLGSDAPTKLPKPTFTPLPPSLKSSKHASKSKFSSTASMTRPSNASGMDAEITFRSLAEDYATENDLVFVPIGRSHDLTGKPLFRVATSITGKGGVTIYIGQDAVFAQGEGGGFKAVSLEEMVKRAKA